jgi:ABC-2 type transport system permease protein
LITDAPSAKQGFLGTIPGALAELYRQRWLVWYFSQREFTKRYQNSVLGLVWAFLGPLFMVALYTLIFSEVLGIRFREITGDSTLNFGLYLYCGLLPFLAYSEALNKGVNSIRSNSNLVEKVVFPTEILPLTSVITTLMDKVFGLGALMFLLIVLEQRLHWTIVLIPLVLIPQLLFTAGLSYLMAVAGTYLPDIRETLRSFIRATFFITPILWPAGRVPESLSFLVDYNPIAYLVESYRALILDGRFPGGMATLYFTLFATALFFVGLFVFNRVKHKFPDMI